MGPYLLRRLFQLAFVLLGVTVVVFALGRVSGDPTTLLMPLDASPEDRARYREQLGLNDPLVVQYGRFLANAVRGDFGTSLVYRSGVLSLVKERIRPTAELGLFGLATAILFAVPMGVLSAVKRNSLWDRLVMVLAMIGQAMPLYWLGLVLVLVFAVHLGVLPVSGRKSVVSIILPGMTLGSYFVGRFARLTRSAMLEVLSEPYIVTARGKGLYEQAVLWRHAFKNAAIPLVTVVGLEIGTVMSGAILTETVFAWPGIGRLAYLAVFSRDFPLLQGIVLFTGIVFVTVNLVVDVAYVYLDPRIRFESRQ